MVKRNFLYFILAIIVLTALFLRIFSKEDNWICDGTSWVKHGNPGSPKPIESCPANKLEDIKKEATVSVEKNLISQTPIISLEQADKASQAIILSPQPNTLVNSPFVVKGSASGDWFSDNMLAIVLLDDKNKLITKAQASTEDDLTTNDLIEFKALLEFTTSATSGYLLINKNNSVGLLEKDEKIIIPIQFLNK